jgi:hypothetical protein
VTGLRLTIPHWYTFDRRLNLDASGLSSAYAWDTLRTAEPAGSFGLGISRADWRSRALSSPALQTRAGALVELLRRWEAASLVSLGVGTGMLEYLIKLDTPEIQIRCGDYAPATVALLRDRFLECDAIEVMDLANPEWVRTPEEVVLLHRVDTELSDDEWRSLFAKLHALRCRHIVFMPAGLLTPVSAASQVRTALAALLHGQALRPSGFLRTSARLRELFFDSYALSMVLPGGGVPIWALERRP